MTVIGEASLIFALSKKTFEFIPWSFSYLEDGVARALTNNLSQFTKEVGEAKSPQTLAEEETREQLEIVGSQVHEEITGVSSALKITPYDLPEG